MKAAKPQEQLERTNLISDTALFHPCANPSLRVLELVIGRSVNEVAALQGMLAFIEQVRRTART